MDSDKNDDAQLPYSSSYGYQHIDRPCLRSRGCLKYQTLVSDGDRSNLRLIHHSYELPYFKMGVVKNRICKRRFDAVEDNCADIQMQATVMIIVCIIKFGCPIIRQVYGDASY